MAINLPFRQIHLDFHTSPEIENVGSDFNAAEFTAALEAASVNSITCFARCHHGFIYYDSKAFPERVHPHLKNKNLLKDQIEACHKVGIRAPIYLTVQMDYYTAEEHPEWLSVNGRGGPIGIAVDPNGRQVGAEPFQAPFYRKLCINSPYKVMLKDMVKDILENLATDGLFFDILWETDCSCKYCRASMLELNMEPAREEERRAFSIILINEFIRDMTAFVRSLNQDCSIYYNNGEVGPGHREALPGFTHLEFDVLPGQFTSGYLKAKTAALFNRTLGPEYIAQTGKFHISWGDFHSFKNKEALEYECFHALALGAKCMIGDQLDPSGKLDKHVYDLIGPVYQKVEKVEPWCIGAKPVTEIGILSTKEFGGKESSVIGAVRMMQEAGHQCDILDSQSDFLQYQVLILPDGIIMSDDLNKKLEHYVDLGGSLIASFESGMDQAKNGFMLKSLGISLIGNGPVDMETGKLVRGVVYGNSEYADYIMPKGKIGKDLPETVHVMYTKCVEVAAMENAEVLADVMEPYFYRTYKHFFSHRQAPSSGRVGSAGIVKQGNVIYFAHAIFDIYTSFAPKWCKTLLLNALDILLPEPLLRHDGPSTIQAYINEQQAENRWVVHLLHYIPQRKAEFLEVIEDTIPIYDIKVTMNAPKQIKAIQLVPEGTELDFTIKSATVEFVVPCINGHQMVLIEF
ncbi:beta-galactosidase [Paenibacillus psychroresistens]|uniref:Beta-galactosidase n=1 Tax=Paenibacillus psychroresistens TaxID=1778678 RepID=A0A6B8RGS1_9BACL|nr:beta-galactosidase trimerization domain-containing protein [Paenibacillus psychroresistens]QGQ95137.1 beta-galactosidase [Paenibacillus psychroresistens]